ncbi:MAG: carbohydrate ABC transporter permease [Ruminococcaceae bacterium]|nr:carbohydrate ABC transporter permease [Oscillospiraceae bacterium]
MAKNPNKIREGNIAFDVLFYALAVFFAFITLYPMYYVLILSLSNPNAAASMRVFWWPKGFFLDGYKNIVTDRNLWLSYRNSIFYAGACCVFMLITCSMCAYPLTSRALRGRKYLTFFLLIPMYFNGGIIPSFLMIQKLGLYNTPWAVILPGSVSIWYIILFRSFFRTIGESLREAAMIDGANHYRVFFNLFMPNSKAILAVIALYTIIGQWNSWFQALIYLPDTYWQPLQLYLRRLLILQNASLESVMNLSAEALEEMAKEQLSNNQLKYTVIFISTLPMLVAYPFFQKYFVKGVMLGSLKE